MGYLDYYAKTAILGTNFSVSPQLLHDKATVKLIRKEPVITLDLHPIDESGLSSTLSSLDSVSNRELGIYPADDDDHPAASSSSQHQYSPCFSAPWPVPFQIPQFSLDVELNLAEVKFNHIMPQEHTFEMQVLNQQ